MYFSGLEPEDVTSSPGSRVVAPKRYADDWPGGPLAANGVRLIVLPLDSDLKVSSAAESVTRDVLKQLSFIKDVFRNVRSGYHVTLYHTSKMMYPCPDATHPTGGVDSSTPPHERPGPTKACSFLLVKPPRMSSFRANLLTTLQKCALTICW